MRFFTGQARVEERPGGARRLVLASPTGEQVAKDLSPEEAAALAAMLQPAAGSRPAKQAAPRRRGVRKSKPGVKG